MGTASIVPWPLWIISGAEKTSLTFNLYFSTCLLLHNHGIVGACPPETREDAFLSCAVNQKGMAMKLLLMQSVLFLLCS